MAKWILLTIALLLFIPGLFYFLFNPIRSDESSVAFKNLAETPALELRQNHIVSMSVATPDGAVWRRIRRSWGDPAYEIALVSSLNERQYCFDGINIRVTAGDQQLNLERAGWMYAFSSDDSVPQQCKSAGRAFRVAPGSVVNITLRAERFGDGEMLVVRPVWDNAKDKLVGVDLDEDLCLVLRWMLVVGSGMLVLTGLMFIRAKHRGKRFARQGNPIA